MLSDQKNLRDIHKKNSILSPESGEIFRMAVLSAWLRVLYHHMLLKIHNGDLIPALALYPE